MTTTGINTSMIDWFWASMIGKQHRKERRHKKNKVSPTISRTVVGVAPNTMIKKMSHFQEQDN